MSPYLYAFISILIFLPSLRLEDVQPESVETDQCTGNASDPETADASDQVTANAEVLMKNTTLKFYEEPQSLVTALAYENVTMECQAGGTPPPMVHWARNVETTSQESDFFSPNHQSEVTDLGISATNARQYFDCVTPEDAGEWLCIAENGHSRISATVRLVVTPNDGREEDCQKNEDSGSAPKIVMWSRKRLEYIGEDARIFCRATGEPTPTVQWSAVEDKQLPSDRYKTQENGDLLIRSIQWGDMGTYKCVASNIHGEDQALAFLYPIVDAD